MAVGGRWGGNALGGSVLRESGKDQDREREEEAEKGAHWRDERRKAREGICETGFSMCGQKKTLVSDFSPSSCLFKPESLGSVGVVLRIWKQFLFADLRLTSFPSASRALSKQVRPLYSKPLT